MSGDKRYSPNKGMRTYPIASYILIAGARRYSSLQHDPRYTEQPRLVLEGLKKRPANPAAADKRVHVRQFSIQRGDEPGPVLRSQRAT